MKRLEVLQRAKRVHATLEGLAKVKGVNVTYVSRILRLTFGPFKRSVSAPIPQGRRLPGTIRRSPRTAARLCSSAASMCESHTVSAVERVRSGCVILGGRRGSSTARS